MVRAFAFFSRFSDGARVGQFGLMHKVQGGRPASMAVTTGAWHTGHGSGERSSFPRWGRGYVVRHSG